MKAGTHRIPRLSEVEVEPLGDSALLVRFGTRIDPEINHLVHALDASLRSQRVSWLRDCVPAYASLAVFYEPDAPIVALTPEAPRPASVPPVRQPRYRWTIEDA